MKLRIWYIGRESEASEYTLAGLNDEGIKRMALYGLAFCLDWPADGTESIITED